MGNKEKITTIQVGKLLEHVRNMKYENYRFVTMTGILVENGLYEVIYHFDKNFKMNNVKIAVSQQTEIPSISEIYFCALLAENEIKELFGLNITDILVDYGGRMLLTEDFENCAPMAGGQITIVRKGGGSNV